MKYRAMIIDDEKIVRNGIKNLIDWEREDFEICAEGKDGKDGLAKILSEQPDLVLIDIKMPGMGGIDVIRAAREQNFEGQFVILTGYSEFEFAKSAISLGVKEYLLKPIDEDELLDIVRQIRKELKEKEEADQWHINNEEKAKKEVMRRMLLNLEPREELAGELERYHIDISADIFCVALVLDKDAVNGEGEEFWGKANELLSGMPSDVKSFLLDGKIVLVGKGMDYKKWIPSLIRANERVLRKFGSDFVISVGHNVTRWYDLCYSYEFARYLMENEFLFSKNKVISMDSISRERKDGKKITAEYLMMLLEIGDLDGIVEAVGQYRQYCVDHLLKEKDVKVQIMYDLMTVKTKIEKKYGPDRAATDITGAIQKMMDVKELDQLLELYVHILQEICRNIGVSDSDTVIKRMYYYMENNYEKDLKLETIAKLFNYNSAYLGKIFRKEIGESFNNVLDTIRITNAKRLLAQTDYKVYQISEMVGYANIDYFYLKFKKYVGISPKEYKKNLSNPETETEEKEMPKEEPKA